MVDVVQPIFDAVLSGGDAAVREFTHQFDAVRVDDLRIPVEAITSSSRQISPALVDAIAVAAANIETFHRTQLRDDETVETMPGVRCWRRSLPMHRVGIYVPGGSAPLVSTVLMLALPARIAGCEEVVMCSPPGLNGRLDPALLHAAHVSGVDLVFRVGGAQAIAAMTYGTESIPKVDKIFGPGNQYVTGAKQYATLEGVAIDMPAGPTEVAIIAGEDCPIEFVVNDILAQAEHGPDSHILVVTTSEVYGRALIEEVAQQVSTIPRAEIAMRAIETSVCVVVPSVDEAIQLCNEYAPEHLIIAVPEAGRLAEMVRVAGSVFVGAMSPESAGDYASGTNHTLPTGGAARAYSGVSVESFMNCVTFQELSEEGLKNLGPTVMELARAEGLEAHRRSVSVRLERLDS